MRTGWVPVTLLLVLAFALLQVSTAGDIYWEGEEDSSNEFLEVKDDSSLRSHNRFKRQWDFSFWPKFTDDTDEDTNAETGSGSDKNEIEQGENPILYVCTEGIENSNSRVVSEMLDNVLNDINHRRELTATGITPNETIRVTFVVMEPYRTPAYSDRDSDEFKNFSRSLANAVDALLEPLPGTQKSSLVRIQSLISDDFLCNVTMDVTTSGNDNTDSIISTLHDHIKNTGRLGEIPVRDDFFKAQLIDPGTILDCENDDYKCDVDRCLPISVLCDGKRDCADGTDEHNCPERPENSYDTSNVSPDINDRYDNNEVTEGRNQYDPYSSVTENNGYGTDNRDQTTRFYTTSQTDDNGYGYNDNAEGYDSEKPTDGENGEALPNNADELPDNDYSDNVETTTNYYDRNGDDRNEDSDNSYNNIETTPSTYENRGETREYGRNDYYGNRGDQNIYSGYDDNKTVTNEESSTYNYNNNVDRYDDGDNFDQTADNEDPWAISTTTPRGAPCSNPIACSNSAVYICPEQRCDSKMDCPSGEDEQNCVIEGDSNKQPERDPWASYATTASPISECPVEDMRCDVTRCVPQEKRCDGHFDCHDGADEADCPEKSCGADDFKCNNGRCIEGYRRCDRVYDCPDREDETNCPCTPNEFRCVSDGSCIEARKQCDNEPQCADGSDEVGCACSSEQWQCDHGNCIKRNQRCDGRVDCPTDRSDERNCIGKTGDSKHWNISHNISRHSYFRCKSGKRIPQRLRCNRHYDCPSGDFSDEKNCPCGDNDFRCDNGFCITKFKRCDRTNDCQDGSDERHCTYGKLCMAFECTNGMCVQAESRCNGTKECDDGSDEANCPCKRGQYQCRDGSCINIAYLCNGRDDCSEGEDEYNCRTCGIRYWQCDNGDCVSLQRRCDGHYDCWDYSDEKHCEPRYLIKGYSCPFDQFTCDGGSVPCGIRCDGFNQCENGEDEEDCDIEDNADCSHRCNDSTCIPPNKICDRHMDCPDGSDEFHCNFCDGPNDFRCNSGECLSIDQRCNGGLEECADGSDEIDCNTTMISSKEPCSQYEFQCVSNKVCINKSFYCDGNEDCEDGSDESNCVCPNDSFQCTKGGCIASSLFCDGKYDCIDGSDELDCATVLHRPDQATTYAPPTPEFGQTTTPTYYGYPDSSSSYPYGYGTEREPPGYTGLSGGRGRLQPGYAGQAGGAGPYGGRGQPDYETPTGEGEVSGGRGQPGYGAPTEEGEVSGGRGQPGYGAPTGEGEVSGGRGQPGYGTPTGEGEVSEGRGQPGYSGQPGETGPTYGGPERGSSGDRGQPGYGGEPGYGRQPGEGGDRGLGGRGTPGGRGPSGGQRWDTGPLQLQLRTYPAEEFVRYGGDVVLQCRDESQIRAPVRWVREGGRPIKPGSTDVNGRLEMLSVSPSDAGVYICQAPGYLGRSEAEVRITLHVDIEHAVTTHPFQSCKPYEATCGNGDCIPKSAVCDKKYDCSDRSDEENCHHDGFCEPNQFKCDNGKCILKIWRCDSEHDCGDGSDERDCGVGQQDNGCTPTEFSCSSGNQCIPKSYHCDGQKDCDDNSDEIGCMAVYVSQPPTPSNLVLNPGDTLILTCHVIGNPVPLISWRRNWGHVPPQCVATSVAGVGTLTCPDMQVDHSGAYSCEAISVMGVQFAVPDAIVFVNNTGLCPRGYFNNEARSPNECIRCFCFGESTQCRSADLFTYNMPTPLGEGGTRLVGIKQTPSGVQVDPQPINNQYFYEPLRNGATVTRLAGQAWWSDSHPYLTLPETYNGNQLTSYGGHIKYTLIPQTKYTGNDSSSPTIIIKGKYGTLVHNTWASDSRSIQVDARLTPEDWMKSGPNGIERASREDIMMTLDNIEMILLRADYNNAGVNISDFTMESAQSINMGIGAASLVEECTCPKGYKGLSCEKCAEGHVRKQTGQWLGECVAEECPAGTYGNPSIGVPCKPCPCPLTEPRNQFATTCFLRPDGGVQCDCFPGYGGEHCQYCIDGYEGNPLIPGDKCQKKPDNKCNPTGTRTVRLPDECICKENVQGRYCDQCKNDSFYLSSEFRQGCALCFCSGVSQQCRSSNLHRKSIGVQFNIPQIVEQVKVYSSAPRNQRGFVHYQEPVVTALRPQLTRDGLILARSEQAGSTVYYWSMPDSFAGDKMTSYGGYLRYTLKNIPNLNDRRYRNNAADIQLISDNRFTFHYVLNDFSPSQDGTLNVTVQLLENGWQRPDGKEIPRQNFLLALADVKTILIKATYNGQLASPISASIDVAEANAYGPTALHVEQCSCPPGYIGTSCEDCAPGYTRSDDQGIYLALCKPCECNNKSNMCSPEEPGVCYDCRDNTAGDHCELCKPGYEKDPYGECVSTRAPEPCQCDPRGISSPCDSSGNCYCKQNVEGESCDRCRPGTFGLDVKNPSGCLSCFCSGVTSDCHEANHYTMTQIAAPMLFEDYGGYTITDLYGQLVIKDHFIPQPEQSELMYIFQSRPDDTLYWSLPVFPGNRVLSYGGSISLTQKFSSDRYFTKESDATDVVLEGDSLSLIWTNPQQWDSGVAFSYQIPLSENGWYIQGTSTPATRSNFMNVLRSLKRVLVRATLVPDLYSTSIADVFMDTAIPNYETEQTAAKGIEVCMCPAGYSGTSCESCIDSYYHDSQGYCQQCPCNGHSCQLNTYGQVVCNCQPPYKGPDCTTFGENIEIETPTRPPPPESSVVVTIAMPNIQIREVGSSVNFTCNARSRNTQSRLPVTWSKSGGYLPQGRTQIDENTGVLTIRQLQVYDSGVYICQSTDGINTKQATATLKVPGNDMTLPVVELTPTMSDYYEGDRIELKCKVTGNPTPNIRWQRGSNRPLPLTAQYYEDVLLIESAKVEDSGEYICVGTNPVGMDDRTAIINIRPRPSLPLREKLSVSNTSPSVNEGQSIRLVCSGSANIPADSIGWIRQDNVLFLSNVRAENGVLYIDYAVPDNQGVYMCQSAVVEVSPVPVLITVVAQGPPADASNITVSEDRLRIPTGGSTTIDCEPHGTPYPMIKWKKHGGDFGRAVRQRGNSLIVSNAQEEDRGYYICEGIVNGIVIKDIYVFLDIERREPPVVEIWPTGEQAVTLGSEFDLSCRVLGGIPEPTIVWSRNGSRALSPYTQIFPGNILKFEKIDVNDEGVYTCTASNVAGTHSASSIIKVRSAPVITITPNNYVRVLNGDRINVECRAEGYPEPMVSIKYLGDNREIASPSPGFAALRVNSAGIRDDGEYACTATSLAGTIEDQFFVRVERGDGGDDGDDSAFPDDGGSGEGDINGGEEGAPDGYDGPNEMIVYENQPEAEINCNATGRVEWARADNEPLQANAYQRDSKLIIRQVSKSDSGDYVCNLYNIYNEIQTASYIRLNVITPPKITLRPPTQTVQPGQSPTVECHVEGDEILYVTWRPVNREASSRVDIRANTLIFHQIEEEDAGLYECIAKSRYATANATAEVIVNEDMDRTPSVSHANEQAAHAGSTVHLSCNVTQPNVRIVWTKDGRSIPRSIRQKNDGSLFIKRAHKSDSGRYVCSIRDLHGRILTSNYINLHIQGFECLEKEFRCYDYSGCVDETLLCDGYRDCQDNSDEENCLSRDKRYSDTIRIPIRLHDGPRDVSQKLVSIVPPQKPFRAGDNVQVLCRSSGRDVKARWERPGTNQYVAFNLYGDGATLVIQGITYADAGVYRCIGTDGYGRTSYDDFNLEVLPGSPGSIYPFDRNTHAYEYTAHLQDSADLVCNHNLEPPVTIEWRREYSPLRPDARSNQPVLRFDSVTEADAGTYICRVSNNRVTLEVKSILLVTGIVPMFEGESFISLPTINDAFRQLEIEISFKPMDKNGLILYNSDKQGREGDYIALQLVNGVPEFIVETGSGSEPIMVRGDRPLQLNVWHTIRLSRLNSRVTMDVDNNEGPFIAEFDNPWRVLDLKQPLYIGGVPDYDQLPTELAGASGFIGCVSMLIIHDDEQNLMTDSYERHRISQCNTCAPNLCLNGGVCQEARSVRGYMCICPVGYAGMDCDRTGEACRPGLCGSGRCSDTNDGYKCSCPVTYTGKNCEVKQLIEYPAFTGSAFLAIKPPRNARALKMSMVIKATPPVSDGIIMYCAESPRGYGGFTSLAVHNGKLEFRYDPGGGSTPVVLVSEKVLPENEWTSVSVARFGNLVSLKINQSRSIDSYEKVLPGPRKDMNLQTPIFVGGVDESITLNNNTGVSGGFSGCIKNFTLGGVAVDIMNETIRSENVQECNNFYNRGDIPEDEGVCQCRNGGTCTTDPSTCACPYGFTGQLCERRVPSYMLSSQQPPIDPCAAHPCHNGGSCHVDTGSRMNFTCDCPLGFAGFFCQMPLELHQRVGFNGNGYLELPASLLRYDNLAAEPAVIAMAIHTTSDGVLLYQNEAPGASYYGDYILLRIDRGFVVFDWDMGSGRSSLAINSVFVNDGEQHTIIVKLLEDGRVLLSVDGSQNTNTGTGISNVMNADSNIYIGGIPESLNQQRYPGFSGCFEQIELMHSERGLNLGAVAVAGLNTQRCKYSIFHDVYPYFEEIEVFESPPPGYPFNANVKPNSSYFLLLISFIICCRN